MKSLVTGGLGFIGSNLVDFLIDKNHEVTVIDNLSTGDKKNSNQKAKYVIKDVAEVTAADVEGLDFVFHVAALPRIVPSFDEPMIHEDSNVVATIKLLETLKGNKSLKKLVYSASSSCYGTPKNYPTKEDEPIDPLSPYALQKYAAEQYCLLLGEHFNIPVNTLRYFNAYGPRSFNPLNKYNAYTSVIGIFKNQKDNDQKLTITGTGRQERDFVHVFDIARANYLAAISEKSGQAYNVGFGKSYSIVEIAEMFEQPYVFIPERKGEAAITLANIDKIKNDLGWIPEIDIKAGIESYYKS